MKDRRCEGGENAHEGQLDREQSLSGKPLGEAESTEDAGQSISSDTLTARGKREENGSLNPIGVGAEDTHPKNRGAASSGRSLEGLAQLDWLA